MIALALDPYQWLMVVSLLHDCWKRGDVTGYEYVRDWAVERYA